MGSIIFDTRAAKNAFYAVNPHVVSELVPCYSEMNVVAMSHELAFHHDPDGTGPRYPASLPEELAAFLKDQDYACVAQATDQGTAFVMKIPSPDIQSVQGAVPVHLRQELYAHPAAPVIRLVFTIYDQPDSPLALESFINITDDQQRADFATLATQSALPLLFYDESLIHRLTKLIPFSNQEDIIQLVETAEQLVQLIPLEQRDFDAAKAAVMHTTLL